MTELARLGRSRTSGKRSDHLARRFSDPGSISGSSRIHLRMQRQCMEGGFRWSVTARSSRKRAGHTYHILELSILRSFAGSFERAWYDSSS